jgi:hypothetical protein
MKPGSSGCQAAQAKLIIMRQTVSTLEYHSLMVRFGT